MTGFNLNHVIALLGFILAIAVYIVMKHYNAPDKVCVGAGLLSAFVVAIFWSSVTLGAEDEDDE